MNRKEAVTILGKRDSKKVDNNTYIEKRDNGNVAVRLHKTDVVTFRPDGSAVLTSGGWLTPTTKDRLNRFSPVQVYSDKGVWYVGSKAFADGMTVSPRGKTTGKSLKAAQSANQKLSKAIRAYIDGFCKSVSGKGLTVPDGGDCWACLLKAENENVQDISSTEPMGFDHLLQHMKESYYVPSLLFKAARCSCRNPEQVWHMMDADAKIGDTRLMRRILASYFRKRKPALLGCH